MRRPYVNPHYPTAVFALDCLACVAGIAIACAIACGLAYLATYHAPAIVSAHYAVSICIALASGFSLAIGGCIAGLLALRDCYGRRYIRRYTLLR